MTKLDAIVIGGGIAGLVAARQLAGTGRTILVLEAGQQPGGCVRFHQVGGVRLDRGAEAFSTARPAVSELAAELGLPTELPASGPAWVYYGGRAAPLPVATMLGIPAHPASADVRRVIGWPGVARALVDRRRPGSRMPGGFGRLVDRRMGRRVLHRLVEPVVAGVYSADPTDLDIDTITPGLRAAAQGAGSLAGGVAALREAATAPGSAVAGITGGMGLLTEALATDIIRKGVDIRYGARVLSVSKTNAGWAVRFEQGPSGDGVAMAHTVVVATPPQQAKALIAGATDGAAVLPTTPASPVIVVTLVVDEAPLDGGPRGSGLLVAPAATDVAAKALTHATAKWAWLRAAAGPGRHVLRLSYGRGGALPPDSAFPALALADSSRLIGVPLADRHLVDHAVVHYPDQLSAAHTGRQGAMAAFAQSLSDFDGLVMIGAAAAGTGLGAVVANATRTRFAADRDEGALSTHDF